MTILKRIAMSKKDLARVTAATKKVKDGDLYYYLHHVGDDPVKADIEDALKELLDEAIFRKVVAVFAIGTSRD